MSSTTWGTPPTRPVTDVMSRSITTWAVDKSGNLLTQSSSFKITNTVGIKVRATDSASAPVSGCQVYVQIRDSAAALVTSLWGFTDATGVAVLKRKTPRMVIDGVRVICYTPVAVFLPVISSGRIGS